MNQPLKITFSLASPIVDGANLLHLDALLAWVNVNINNDDYESIGDALDDLPLDSVEFDGMTVWKASKLTFNLRGGRLGVPVRRMFIRKTESLMIAEMKNELNMFHDKKNSGFKAGSIGNLISNGSGWSRNFQEFYPVKDCVTAVAYCIGDKKAIEDALKHIKWLGKRGVAGSGKVTGILVEVDENANHLWKQRALPAGMVKDSELSQYYPAITTVSNPYWMTTNKVVAMLPL